MKHITLTITAILLTAGCDLEPLSPDAGCDPTSPLYPHLTPEEKAECSDGTGDEDEDGETNLSCIGDIAEAIEEFCVIGDPLPGDFGPNAWHGKDLADCHTPTSPIQCIRSWWNPEALAERGCVLCEANIMAFDLGVMHPTHTGDWPMCKTAPNLLEVYHQYRPAYDWAGTAPEQPDPDWFDAAGCTLDSDVPAGTCEPVLISTQGKLGVKDGFITGEWTCRCSTDNDCQPDAVCEAGWIIDGGIPQPTLCKWDDGTPNGSAPEGPVVYGLGEWEDGIHVAGDRIVLEVAGPSTVLTRADYLTRLVTGALNDDHRFGILGDLTYIGPDSLAAHLGLEVGDMLDVDKRGLLALALGEVVDVTVVHVDGSERVLTVSVE